MIRRLAFLSLCLNLVLVLAWGWRWVGVSRSDGPAASPAPSSLPQLKESNHADTSLRDQELSWSRLAASDMPSMVRNLRAAGLSEDMVRAVVEAELDRRYVESVWPSNPRQGKAYWQAPHPEEWERWNQTNRAWLVQKSEVLQAVFPNANDRMNYEPGTEDSLRHLSREKQKQVAALRGQALNQKRALAQQSDISEDEFKQRAAQIDAEYEQAFARLLSPSELEEYFLRRSPLTARLRDQVFGLQLSGDEFRELARVLMNSSSSDASASTKAPTAATDSGTGNAGATGTNRARALLGDMRYEAMIQASDPAFLPIYQVVRRYDLSFQAAQQVMDARQAAQHRRQQILADSALNQDQKNSALQSLQLDTEQAIVGVLGLSGFQTYRRQGGEWVLNLAQP
jgi:hypothetical protein